MLRSYDNIAKNYTIIAGNSPYHTMYVRPNMLRHLPNDLSGKKILDLGCGVGWYSQFMQNKGADVTAIDSSNEMLSIAKPSIINSINYINYDLNNKLDFINNDSFDIIIAPLLIHYIKDIKQAFLDYYRILKTNGTMIFSTHNPYVIYKNHSLSNYFESQIISEFWSNIGPVEFYHHSLDKMFSSIINAGFNIKVIEEPQPLEKMKEIDVNLYNSLTKKPCFLFGVLFKND